jgi:endonuclease-3 related protein
MDLFSIYRRLLSHFGKQNWWPSISENRKFEVIIGAILTQQATWQQVEKAIKNLHENNLLNPTALSKTNIVKIQNLIRPSGFYKQKTKRIVNFSKYLMKNYSGDLDKLFNKPLEDVRKELLSLDGIGKETADSILLYAADKLIFPIDAYTFRLFERLGVVAKNYDELQKIFHENLPKDLEVYKEFHALIVKLGKTHCKIKPECNNCPLTDCSSRKR